MDEDTRTFTEYYRSLSDEELDDLSSEEYVELMNHVMAEEEEILAEKERRYSLPRGFWTPAEREKYIDESQGFLDARWAVVEEIEAREEAAAVAREEAAAAAKETERRRNWKPRFV